MSPSVDVFLAIGALLLEVRELLMKGHFENDPVEHPGDSLAHHPEVMTQDNAPKDINGPVSLGNQDQ